MTRDAHRQLPDPTIAAATLWLKSLDRTTLHGDGWIAVNKRFHGLAMAARPFMSKHFETDAEQEAAFDGMVLALMTMAHFEDVEQLSTLFTAITAEQEDYPSLPATAAHHPDQPPPQRY